jgi:hypothetical protein
VFADQQQQPPLIDGADSVQVQLRDRGAASRGQADDERAVFAPGEVLVPVMIARVEERDGFACERVEGVRLVVLEVVAPLAGAGEVLRVALTAST